MMQHALSRPDPRLAARVPRYTSYPSANHFGPDVDAGTVSGWLGAIPAGAGISLYVHIPFCRRLCWFCACRTQGTRTAAPVDAYIGNLLAELALLRAAVPQPVKVRHLHWGGGTPTLLTPAQMTRLAGALGDAFPLAPDAEFAVEIDPTELDDARLDALAALGLRRASVGVQDFDPEIQAAIGREQSAAVTLRAIAGLRRRGVGSLNIDLLYGLPFQTPASLTATLEQVIDLGPDRLALYGYAHVPWMARRQQLISEEALPGSSQRLELSETARSVLRAAGYVGVGIDHFARPGDSLATAAGSGALRRNFQGYTTDTSEWLIGVGASAVSRYPQGYAQNAARTGDWAARVTEGRLATARGHTASDEDRLRARVIGDIMCRFATDTGAVARDLGLPEDTLDPALARVQLLHPDAVTLEARRLSLTHTDGRFARLVAAEFDAYLMLQTLSYSPAI